jgi:2-polyprenyl-3-methyl-5-hydroxy-6-metoxy-1,4-benzoquinol methylase
MNPWDERYSVEGFVYGREPNDFLLEQESRIPRGGRVLCLAEGEGRNAVFLAGKGHSVLAVDQSSVGLNKLHRLAHEMGVRIETLCCDLAHFQIEAAGFDAIVSIWCHVPIELRRKLHADCVQGLKSGGVLILEAYHPKQLKYGTGGPPTAELMMTAQDLNREFLGLHPWISCERERAVYEGTHHVGLSFVTQWAGMKP